ncbi:MAG: hypothetical protein ACJA01_003359 [Saprospiraceae bacterium]|jgi:hypothetical protein
MIRLILISLILILLVTSAEGQLFKKLGNRIQDKIERKVEDKVVEEVSEEIANRAMRPIDDAIESMFRTQYKETYGEEYDDSEYEGNPEGRAAAMQGIMAALYGNVELPEQFAFSHDIHISVYDYGNKKANKMVLMVGSDGATMGFKNEDNKEQVMVFDFVKDQFAMFDNKKKTVMAMSGVFSMATAFAQSSISEDHEKFKFEKMNKTKTILGYKAQGYKAETKDEKSEFYMSEDLPFDWSDMYGNLVEKMSANFYAEDSSQTPPKGMLLEAKTKRKKDKKESKWIVDKISSQSTVISISEYKNSLAQN